MSTRKAQQLTLDQHIELGKQLGDLHFKIWELLETLQKGYSKSSTVMRAMARLAGGPFGLFLDLKNHLDNSFFEENPAAAASDSPYYGWSRPDGDGLNIIPIPVRRRKPGRLSAKQHQHVAEELRMIESGLLASAKVIWDAYGGSSPAGRAIEKLVSKKQPVLTLRLALKEAAVWEHGTEQTITWYASTGTVEQEIKP